MHIGDLRGRIGDRVAFVELAICDGRLVVIACSFYEDPNAPLGRRPKRAGFLKRPTIIIELARPIRTPSRVVVSLGAGRNGPNPGRSAIPSSAPIMEARS